MKVFVFLGALILSAAAQGACPTGTESRGVVAGVERCALRGTYLSTDLRLTADNVYLIEDGVFIGDDNKENSTLRIEAGTKILGNPGAFVSIMRGSKIFAEGTAENPIVFTALKESGRKRGEWGGLVLNGNAPINACKAGASVCEAISEGIKAREVKFGGNNASDNSGILRYVRVEFAGYPVSPDNELNGITFNAVGDSTEVDHIQVHMNSDDGIEFFGGTVNVKHVVLTANEDDSLDWDMGWVGKAQFVVIDQGQDQVDNGFEADNYKSPMNASPRSNPFLSNFTLLGSSKSAYGMLLRRGTGAQMSNFIIKGFAKACIDIDDAETFNNATTGMTMTHTVLDCAKNFESEAGDLFSTQSWFAAQPGNTEEAVGLVGWMPAEKSSLLHKGVTPEDLFFDPVEFIGAFGADDWAAGWITQDLN